MQPYTVWTYFNYNSSNEEYSDGRIASALFQDIAIVVIKNSNTATINKVKILDYITKCKGANI